MKLTPRVLAHSRSLRPFLAVLVLSLGSCFSTRPKLEEAHSGPAEDPVELAELHALVGVWDGTATATIHETGEVHEARSVHRVQWEAGGQFLIERTATSTGGAEPTTSIGVWTWDDFKEVYRCWRFDSRGAVHQRTMTWNEAEERWDLEMSSTLRGDPVPQTSKGTLRFVTPDERHYTWDRFEPGAEKPWVSVEGTSKRVEVQK